MKLHWKILLIIHITLHLCCSVASQRHQRSRTSIERSSLQENEDVSSSTEIQLSRGNNRRGELMQKSSPRSYSRRLDNAGGERRRDEPVRMDVVISEPDPSLPRSVKNMRTGRRKDSQTSIIPVVNNGAFGDTRQAKGLGNTVRLVLNPEDTSSTSHSTSRENRQALNRRGSVASTGRGRQRYSYDNDEISPRRSDFIDESNLEIYNLDMETGKIESEREYNPRSADSNQAKISKTSTTTQATTSKDFVSRRSQSQISQRRRSGTRSTTTENVENSTHNIRSRNRPPTRATFAPIEALRERQTGDTSTERVTSKYRTRPTSSKPTQKQRHFRERDNVPKSSTSTEKISSSTMKAFRKTRPVRPLSTSSKSNNQDVEISRDSNQNTAVRGNFRPNFKSDISRNHSGKSDSDEDNYENENYPEHFKSLLQAKSKSKSDSTHEALSTKASEVVLNLHDESVVPVTTFSPPYRHVRVRPIPLMDASPEGIENSKDPIKTERLIYKTKQNHPEKIYYKSQEQITTTTTEIPRKTTPKFTRTYIFNATRNNLLKKEKLKESQEIVTTERNTKFSPVTRTKIQRTKPTFKSSEEVTPRYSSEDYNNLIDHPSSEAYVNVLPHNTKRAQPALVGRQNEMRNSLHNAVIFKPKNFAQRKSDKRVTVIHEDNPSLVVNERDKYVVPLHTGQRTNRFSARYKSPLNKPSPPAYNPTVPSVTSTTAWLKFFVTDAPIPENLTEPIWFVAADGQSQWKSDHQIIRSSDHHLTDVGEQNNIYPDIEIISFNQPRSTPISDSLITAESSVMTSRLLNVETSNHSPSVTVSIFDALADILTSTPKIHTSTKKIVENLNVIGVSTESVSGSTKGSLIKDIESTRIDSTVQTESDTSQVTITKPVKTTPRWTPNSSTDPPSSSPSSPKTVPVTERKPFATLILYSTTQPPAHTASLASVTYVTPPAITSTEQANIHVANNNLPLTKQSFTENNKFVDAQQSNTLLSNEPLPRDGNNDSAMFNFAFLYNFISNSTPPSNEFIKRFENLLLKNLNINELGAFSSTPSSIKVDDSIDNNSVESTSPLPVVESRSSNDKSANIPVTEISIGTSSRQSRLLETMDSKTESDVIIVTPSATEIPLVTTTQTEKYYNSITDNIFSDIPTTEIFLQQNSLETTYISNRKSSSFSTSDINENSFMPNTEETVVTTLDPRSESISETMVTTLDPRSESISETMVTTLDPRSESISETMVTTLDPRSESTSLNQFNIMSDLTSTQSLNSANTFTVTTESETLIDPLLNLDMTTEQSVRSEKSTTKETNISILSKHSSVPLNELPTLLEEATSTETSTDSSFDSLGIHLSVPTTAEYSTTGVTVAAELEKSTMQPSYRNVGTTDSDSPIITTDFTPESVFQTPTPATIFPDPSVNSELLTILNMLASFNVNASSNNGAPKQSLSRRAKLLRDIEKIILENNIDPQEDITNSSAVEFSEFDNKDLQVITIPALKDIMSTIFPDVVSSTTENTTPDSNTEQTTQSYTTQSSLNVTILHRSNIASDNNTLTVVKSIEIPPTTTETQTQQTFTQIPKLDDTTETETSAIPSTTPPYQWVPPYPTAWRNKQLSMSNSSRIQNNSVLATTEKINTTSRPKKDYYVYGVLPNNTVVRKNPNNNELETLTEASPFIIFGVLPNNSVIRRYPNGTRVPPVTQKIDILPIDPRSLKNPNSPVYKDPESIKPININNNVDDINTNEITQTRNTESLESNNSKNNETEEAPVHITETMLSNNLTTTKQSSVVNRDSVTATTESYVLSLLTTAKLPKVEDIVLSSIVAASKEESNAANEPSTTPRYLTLDIDPETKKIRTEKPVDGSEGVVFRWKPITDDLLTTPITGITKSTESYIQKITMVKPSITTTTIPSTTTTSTPTSTPASITSTVKTIDEDKFTLYNKLANNYNIQTTTQLNDLKKPTETTLFDARTDSINQNVINNVEIFSRGGKSHSLSSQSSTVTTSAPYVSTTIQFATSTTQRPTETTAWQASTTTQAPTTTTQRRVSTSRSTIPTTTTQKRIIAESTTTRRKVTESTTRRRTEPPTQTIRTTTLPPIEVSSAVSRLKYFDINQSPSLANLPSTATSTIRPIFSTGKPISKVSTIAPDKSTYSVEEDIAFLTTLQKLVVPKSETKEQTLANRIIALAVERNLANLKSSTSSPSSTTRKITTTTTNLKPTTTTTTTTESITENAFRGGKKYNIAVNNDINIDGSKSNIKTSTPSIEEDIASFQKDAQLLQSLLKLTGQDPSKLNIPSILATPTRNSIPLSSSTTTRNVPISALSASSHRPQVSRSKASKPEVSASSIKSTSVDVEKLNEEAILLQNLLKIQNAGESTTVKINLANLDDEKALAALLAATKKSVSTTSIPIKLSTEYGQSNEALLAALLKDQGIGPSTPHDQKRLAALLNQVIVTPKARTTTRRPPPTRQPRPVLDGLAWLWQQWQDTGSGPVSGGPRETRRPTPVSAGGGGFLFGSGPFVGNADDVDEEKPQSNNKKVPLPPPQVVDSSSGSNTGLVTAAINVTRAFSQFLGAAIQGAASTFQTVVRAGQKAAGNYYSAGSG